MSLDIREQAKNNLDKLSTESVMCAFDIIGRDYLNGEASFVNNSNGIYDLMEQFELTSNEMIEYLLYNEFYHNEDSFLSFDGETLCSFRNLNYFKHMILKKMNGECAEFILGELNEV